MSTPRQRPTTIVRVAVGIAMAVALAAASACGGEGGESRGTEQLDDRTHASTPRAPVSLDDLASPDSAAETAEELTEIEAALRRDQRDPTLLRELGRRQQLAYRVLSSHPGWIATAQRRVPAALGDAVQANVDAGAALSALTGAGSSLPTSFPDWKVIPPLPAPMLRGFYDEAEAATGVPWAYLAAIHLVETRMGRIRGTSTAGAQGPMQFIPETWASVGEGDILDDHDAIQAAGRYLASRGAPDDMDRALFSYNNDDRYVAAIKAYASVMLDDPRAYDGYHQWQVFYATPDDVFLLPEGYGI
jgi:hypothetical protein